MPRILKRADGLLCDLLVLLTAALVAVCIAQVVWRYALNDPLMWAEEAARYMMIWLVFLGAGPALARGAHFSVDYFAVRLPAAMQALLRAAIAVGVLVFALVLVAEGWMLSARVMDTVTPALQVPTGAIYLALPMGAAIMAGYALAGLVEAARGARGGA